MYTVLCVYYIILTPSLQLTICIVYVFIAAESDKQIAAKGVLARFDVIL